MFQSYFTDATKERLSKYKFEHRWGLDSGSTRVGKNVSRTTRRALALQRSLPLIWGAAAVLITVLAQASGVAIGDDRCDAFWVPETLGDSRDD
mmetsp:Transcript_14273/g.41956  ORF Transcript_14273/g.41956 Transcript_14273/m.41956 type:complete len:93 (-) Transcript_14273:745-1023(-)